MKYSSDEGDTSSGSDDDEKTKMVRLQLPDQPRDAWCDSVLIKEEEGSANTSPRPKVETSGSPSKVKVREKLRIAQLTLVYTFKVPQVEITEGEKILTPRRISLRMPRAILDLADSDVPALSDDPPPAVTSLRRHRRREWVKRTSQANRNQPFENKNKAQQVMPPELIVVQAQVVIIISN